MSELTKEERLARALSLSQAEENVQEEPSKPLTKEERLARALELSQAEDKKKSQSQSGSSTEESSSGTSETKKEQSSGTTKPLSLEEKKALARGQKLGQLEEKKQESKLALERKQKSTNINWDVDKETEQAFKGVATKEEKIAQAKQEAMSVGETYVPNIEEKSRAKEIQEAKPEQDLQRRLNLIPKEDLKSIFEGDSELTMFDGGQRLAEKYKLTEEEVDKAKAKYLEETVKEFKRKDLESSLDLINKYAPAPKDFKDITAYTQNMELLNKAKEMNFEKNKNLSFSLMGLEDNDRKVVDEYSSVMDRLNAYKSKSFMQQQQGADETGKGSMVINPKEVAQFEKDLKESQRLSKEIDKIRGNNNKLFDQYANVINKETGETVTQQSFTSKYENDYMKLKGALTDATYKLNYLEKEARGIRDAERKGGRILTDAQLNKQNAKLSNLDRERNLAKAEVLALSNALFLNEDITKKVARYEKADSYYQMPGKKAERLFEVLSDLKQGFSETVLGEFNMASTSEKNQARILNEKLKEVGINLKDIDKEIAPTFPEKMGNVLGTSAVLGTQIALTSFLTGGAGTLARGAGLLPKVFAMYDKGGKFSKIANMVISGINFELASDDTSFAMGAAEEGAQIVFEKVFSKLKPLSPLVNFLTKSLTGAIGVTGEEYFGDLAEQFTKTGISQETLDATFGKTREEGIEKFELTFAMGMMSIGKHAKVLMVGSYKAAKAKSPNSEGVKAMENVMSEMGVDPDDVIKQLKAEAQKKSDRLYPDGKGGQLSASNMTVEQEIVLREKLKYKPLTEEELDIKRTVQEQEELAPADSPYVTKKEMDDDLKVLKGEDEGKLPETYVGESVRTEEGIVTTVTEKVEEGTQLRVPTEQLVVEEAKPVAETFDRKKAGVIDVWQDTETNELHVINGTKRVATAMEDGVASVDVNFVKANSLEEAYKIGDLKNKLEDTNKTIDAVELVKANPTLKENLDLSKPKESELYGLASLNESLTEELKSNPNQAGVLSIIGNYVPIQNQNSVYEVVKRIGLTPEQTSVLVKMPGIKNVTKTFVDNKQKALSSVEETTKALDKYEQENELEIINLRELFNLDKGYTYDSGAGIENLQKLARKGNKMGNVKKPSSLKFLPKKITLKHLVRNAKDKKSILKEGFNFEKLDNDSNVPGAYFSSEDWSTVGRFGREQENALFVDIENEGLIYFDTAEDFEVFLEENGIDSNKGLSFEEIKPLLDMGVKGILLKEDVVSRQRNELIVIDGSIIKGISENQKDINNLPSSFPSTKSVAQEYHKAKKDGSNPELVEAVESIFTEDKSYQNEKKVKQVKKQLSSVEGTKDLLNFNGKSKHELEYLSNKISNSSNNSVKKLNEIINSIKNGVDKETYEANIDGKKTIIPTPKAILLNRSKRELSEEYHKAKKDGSNPELVEAVESVFLGEQNADVELKAEVEIKTELSKTGQSNIDALSEDATQLELEPELLGKATKKEVVKTNKALSSVEETTKALDFENTSNEELQTIYDNLSSSNNKEAKRLSNLVENVQEKNERNSILNTALSNVKNIVGKIIKSGEYFLEKREAREAIEVAEKYSGTVEKQEAKKDFKDAFFGNPNNWVADALKMREATRAFMEQGGTFKELLQSVQKEFEFDGYSEQEAASFIKSKLESITKKDFRQKSIAEEYHKAKKDGSNPELVEAVESVFLGEQNTDIELKAEVEIKTELSKTGQSNIDALSEDATQLGLEPETLYDRVLSNSPTVKALTEKYAKGVASGLYSTTEATNRLNAEIKENLDAIKKEAGLDEAKKEVAQLESALTSDKKTSSDVLRDIASKIDKLANGINTNPNSSLKVSILFGTEPYIAKAFLKTLSATLKTSATFIDGFNKAIAKFKNSDILKGKTAQEINDIVAQLTKATTDIKQTADLKNPITKLQQSKVKQNVRDRIKHLYKTQMTSLPTLKSIEKIATNYGIIDAKTFAEKLYKDLDGLEKTRAKRMETFEGAISDFITKGGGNIKSLFNQLSTLILKDKEQAVILKNTILKALTDANTKGLKFSQQQLNQITSAFEKANLTNLSGIYDLTSKIDQIVNKAVDITLNNKINDLQKSIRKSSRNLKQVKQREYIKELINLNGNQITNQELKNDLISILEDVKEYLGGKDNLNYNESKLDEFNKSIKEYNEAKEEALIEKMYETYKKDNPGTTITLDEYKQFIYPTEKDLLDEAKLEESEKAREKRKEEKRKKLETLTLFNIQELLSNNLNISFASKNVSPNSSLNLINYEKLKDTLKFFVDNNHLKDLDNKQLEEIIRVINELQIFDSSSRLGTLTAELSGIKKAIENQDKMVNKLRTFNNRLKNALFSPDGDPIFGKGNELVGFHRLIERMFVGQEADTIGAIMFKSLFNGVNTAKSEFNVFAKKLKKLAQFELRNTDNYNLGVKAYLLSSPKDISELEAQILFERKKEKIKLDIDRLTEKSKASTGVSYSTKKAAEQRVKLYQEALNDISKYDTYQDLLDAYNNDSLLNKEQKAVYELTRGEYERIKPLLIDSNIAYGDKNFVEENNYTSISYLRMDAGKSDDNILDPNFTNKPGIMDAQSGTVFARVENPLNVKDVLDFDFYNVSKRRVFETQIDVHTRGSRLELSSFMDSKQFREVFKNNDDLYNIFKDRVSRYANSVLSKQRTNLNVNKKHIQYVRNLISNVKLAYLARTGQALKQPAILVHSASRLGVDFFKGLKVFLGNVGSVEGREKLNELLSGSDTSNRANLGDEQFSQMVSKLSTYDLTDSRFYQTIQKWLLNPVNQGLNAGNLILTHPDLFSNTVTYIGAMIKEQKKQRKAGASNKVEGFGIDELLYNKDLENTYKADRIAGFINNESDVAKQGGMFTDQGLGAQLFYQFKSMSVNAAVGAQNALLDLTDSNATRKDKEIAVLNLVGYVGAIIAFQTSKELLKDLWDDNLKEGAKKITGRKLERPEDKRKSFVDNFSNPTYLSEYAYRILLRSATDVFAGGVMPSGVSDLVGKTALEPASKALYKTTFSKEYAGEDVFFGNWKELGGGIKTLIDVTDAATDIVSPYVYDAEEKRKVLSSYAIAKTMFEAGYNRPLETTADILYFLSITQGKGMPSEFLGTIKKVIKNNYKVKDGKFERLNPMQKAKEDK